MCLFIVFFFNDTATTEIYTLSLHDALPILDLEKAREPVRLEGLVVGDAGPVVGHDGVLVVRLRVPPDRRVHGPLRSEEHTSELQSRQYLVCRLLLEKKKKYRHNTGVHMSQV